MNTEVTSMPLEVMSGKNTPYDVIIVEDNLEQAYLTKMLVEEYGFSANYVTNSSEALQFISTNKPRVVILDLMMPKLDGLRLCKEIKSTNGTEDTRIIIYSGKIYDSDLRKALEMGADAFFTKPTRANVLISKIKELIHPVQNGSYQN